MPLSRTQREAGDRFCCSGCELVYGLINEQGLERYYEIKRDTVTAPPVSGRPDPLAWLDRALAETQIPEGALRSITFDVQGVRCAACVWLLEELFRRKDGAVDLRLNPAVGRADLTWVEGTFDPHQYVSEARTFGYRFGSGAKPARAASSSLVVRMGICIALAMNTMIFSLCFYLGLAPSDGRLFTFIGLLTAGLATLSVGVGGWVFIRDALRGATRGIVHLDLPIAAGIVLAYLGSLWVFVRSGPEAAYFDTVAIFVALMLVGRWLQERVIERNRADLLLDGGAADFTVRRVRGGDIEAVPVTVVAEGDELRIVPGELIPLRSRVLERDADVSLDWISGESEPMRLFAGGEVPAGAFNASAHTLRVTALEPFEASRLQSLVERPERARSASAFRFWKRLSRGYVASVLGLAALGFALWLPHGGTRAVEVAVAILVVTCPCALGIAVPVARELVQTALRRRGVFLREIDLLDRALRVKHVIFDKTGTVTLGRLRLDDRSRAELSGLSAEHRTGLFAMASQSNHPVSRAIASAMSDGAVCPIRLHSDDAPSRGAQGPESADPPATPVTVPGAGLELMTGQHTMRLGASGFAATAGIPDDEETIFSVDGRTVARFSVVEDLRRDAVEEIARLQRLGHDVHLLSGDRDRRVADTARVLGIPEANAHARQTPEEKARVVAALDDENTLMVGDGVNDALGFDAAFTTGTPAVDRTTLPGRADFYFLGEDLAAVRLVLDASLRLRRAIRRILIAALAYNLVALALCFSGLVTPLTAAILMPLSSIGVVLFATWQLTGRRLAWMY